MSLLPEARIERVEPCKHGRYEPHRQCANPSAHGGLHVGRLRGDCWCEGPNSRTPLDAFPPEAVEAAVNAAEAVFRASGYKNKGLSILLDKAVEAALSAAFRTLGETQ